MKVVREEEERELTEKQKLQGISSQTVISNLSQRQGKTDISNIL